MKYELKYGKGSVSFEIKDQNFIGDLLPNDIVQESTGVKEVIRALKNPIGTKQLHEIVKPGEKIVIITSDITRPMPSRIVLPPVLEELEMAGVKEEDILIVLALGSHRKHTEEEKRYIVGDTVYDRNINIVDSDSQSCVNLGVCQYGTPVDIFKPVAQADRIICLGNIEYHYFAGYSGGAKAIMPGVSSSEAIQANHSNMVKEGAKTGNIDNNPVRKDIDQIGEFLKIDFIVNVVLDEKKEIVKAVAGHYIDAHREGCKFLNKMYAVPIQDLADIVVVSSGGFPKDMNLYQSQKSLDNAKHAVKDGGIIILVASAKEGFGQSRFEEWMLNKEPDDMIEEIKSNFKLGGHKAAAIAMVMKRAKIFLISDLDADLIRSINMESFDTVQEAIDTAIIELGPDSKVLVMPIGGSTLPLLNQA